MGIFSIFFFILMLIILIGMAIPPILSFLGRHHVGKVRNEDRNMKKNRKEERRRKKDGVYVSKYPENTQRLNTDGVGKYVDFEEIKDE